MMIYLEKQKVGTVQLGDKVRVSDPCYDEDVWCAGTLKNVLPGEYECYTQGVDTGSWGIRIAYIEVRHSDFLDVDPTEVMNIDVGVDSGQCGIYDLPYFIEARKDKDGDDIWYDKVCKLTGGYFPNPDYKEFEESSFYKPEFDVPEKSIKALSDFSDKERLEIAIKVAKAEELTKRDKEYLDIIDSLETMSKILEKKEEARLRYLSSIESASGIYRNSASVIDDKGIVSSSGYGDGSYICLVGRDDNGNIVSIKVDYFFENEDEDNEDEK